MQALLISIKDSTGMCARVATLLDAELLRTLFSFLDKIDSPICEAALQFFRRLGVNSPQVIYNMTESMVEEVIQTSDGSIENIHFNCNKKIYSFKKNRHTCNKYLC